MYFEKRHTQMQKEAYLCFIDYTNTFDKVHHKRTMTYVGKILEHILLANYWHMDRK